MQTRCKGWQKSKVTKVTGKGEKSGSRQTFDSISTIYNFAARSQRIVHQKGTENYIFWTSTQDKWSSTESSYWRTLNNNWLLSFVEGLTVLVAVHAPLISATACNQKCEQWLDFLWFMMLQQIRIPDMIGVSFKLNLPTNKSISLCTFCTLKPACPLPK